MKPVFQWVYAPEPGRRPGPEPARGDGAISDRIARAFDAASSSTGTPFDYLLRTAQRESALDPTARAPTSTATGLFQFIESTWLETLKASGAAHGLGGYADRIVVDASGRHSVPDPADRREILALRNDPEIAALMAGELTRRNAAALAAGLGRTPSSGELYIAHFLGAKGATDLIRLAEARPDAPAADRFPAQAAANRRIFYEGGVPRTAAAVYAELVSTHRGLPAPAPEDRFATAFAALEGAAASDGPPDGTATRVEVGWRAMEPGNAFAGLFRTDGTAGPAVPAGFFRAGYGTAPALFEVAVAEDEARPVALAAPLPPARPSPSLAAGVPRPGSGPLDLSAFLVVQGG